MENHLKGKRVLFMGDSITALYMGERGWVRYFREILEPAHTVCVAVAGARWCDSEDTVYDGEPVFRAQGANPNNTMGNQIEKIKRAKAKGDPDFADFDAIIMAAGTNDKMPESREIADAQFFDGKDYVPLEHADRKVWGGAVRYVSESLYGLYPDAVQFICTPIQACDVRRSFRSILEKGNALKELSARLSVRCIDTIHCGIYGRYEKYEKNGRSLIDGLHPNSYGAKQMGTYIAMAVKTYLG